jgi:hydrogenase expression/formation protein HypC
MCLAIPGKVLEVSETNGVRAASVNFGGIVRQVCLDYLPGAQAGDYVIVHVGFAIGKVDRGEAERTYKALESVGLLEDEFPPTLTESRRKLG